MKISEDLLVYLAKNCRVGEWTLTAFEYPELSGVMGSILTKHSYECAESFHKCFSDTDYKGVCDLIKERGPSIESDFEFYCLVNGCNKSCSLLSCILIYTHIYGYFDKFPIDALSIMDAILDNMNIDLLNGQCEI